MASGKTIPRQSGLSAVAQIRRAGIDARVKLACLVVYVVAALHAHTLVALSVCVVAACVAMGFSRCTMRDVGAVVRPLVPILAFTVVMQVLSIQQGQVLLSVGPISVTSQALAASARMVASLAGIMMASIAFMRSTTTEELMCMLGWLLGPLRAFGVRTDAFMLSLSVAFRFVPALVTEFAQLKRAQEARGKRFEGGVRTKLGAYARLFAPLVRSSFRRADMLAEAFLARCFGCADRSWNAQGTRVGAPEVVLVLATTAVLVVVVAL